MSPKTVKEPGITIPRNPDKTKELSTLEQLLEYQKLNHETMTEAQKINTEFMIKILEAEEEKKMKQAPIWKGLMGTILNPINKKFALLRNKLTEKYHKVFIKGDFFGKLGKSIRTLISNTGSFLWKALKMLLLLAVFDPKGKMLKSLMKPLKKAMAWIVKTLIKNIPKIISSIIYIVTQVLPPILLEIGKTLWGAIRELFKAGKIEGLIGLSLAFLGISKILSKLIPGLGSLNNIFGGMFKGIKKFIGFMPKVGKGIFFAFKGIAKSFTKFGSFLTKIPGIFSVAFNGIAGVFTKFGSFLTKIPRVFAGAFKGIVGVFTKFSSFLTKIPGVLTGIFKGIAGTFTKFGSFLTKIPGVFSAAFKGIAGVFTKFGSFMSKIGKGLKFIFLGIGKAFRGVMTFLPKAIMALSAAFKGLMAILVANPIILIVVAIIAALVALWVWRDKVAAFFESIFKWFSKLSKGMKIFIGVLAAIFFPLTLAAAAIYKLVKLFQSFSKIGVAATFKLIWKNIKNFFSFIKKSLNNLMKAIGKGIKNFLKSLWKSIKKLGKMYVKIILFLPKLFWKVLKNLPSIIMELIFGGLKALSNIGSFIWGGLVKGFNYLFTELPKNLIKILMGIFDPIKKFFSGVINWFSTIARVGLGSYLWMSSKEKEQAQQLTKMVRTAAEAKEKGVRMPKVLAKFAAAEKSDVKFKELLTAFKDMSTKQVEVQVKQVEAVSKAVEKSEQRAIQTPKFTGGMRTATATAR
jgi:hypothetical protein